MLCGVWGLSSLTKDCTRIPCIWKHVVLTPEPPGKSPEVTFFFFNSTDLFIWGRGGYSLLGGLSLFVALGPAL